MVECDLRGDRGGEVRGVLDSAAALGDERGGKQSGEGEGNVR